MNTEKRIFTVKPKPLTDEIKNDLRRRFFNYIKNNVDKTVEQKHIYENEDEKIWSLMYCNGVRIFRFIHFKNERTIDSNKYTSVERKCLINIFIKLTSALFKEEVKFENVLEEETDEKYVLTYLRDGAKEFSFEYKKHNLMGLFNQGAN